MRLTLRQNRTGKKLSVIIGIIRSGMPSNACSASSSTIAELPLDTRKRLLIHGDAVVFLGTFMTQMKRQQNLDFSFLVEFASDHKVLDLIRRENRVNINNHEIHLWFANDQEISDSELIAYYLSILNDAEKQQQQRFHFEAHRHQYLITRALVRSTLSLYIDEVEPDQWVFTKNPYGKPAIKNKIRLPLKFNLSHTQGRIVMAVTLAGDVGVDIEWLLREGQTLDIADHFFSIQERVQLYTLPEEHRKNRFFDLWTLKEAHAKAYGMGLSIPLEQFSFDLTKDDILQFRADKQSQIAVDNWLFWQSQLDNNYKVALALRAKNPIDKVHSISLRRTVPMCEINTLNIKNFKCNQPKLIVTEAL